ncbi:MAG: regulatory protein [Solirubrobacterales bacterium]|nr:regulatory protein [Solirubrobacterales bacterium]
MPPAFAPAHKTGADAVWRDILVPLCEDLRDDSTAVSLDVVRTIQVEFPELFPDEDTFEGNRAASEQNILLIIGAIREGQDPADLQAPTASMAYLRDAVHSGVPVEAMLRSLRLGHAKLLDIMLDGIRARTTSEEQFAGAASLATAWSFAGIDRLSTLTTVLYAEERGSWMRSAAFSQTETVRAILAGREIDAQTAGQRLRYPLERHHTALMAWVSSAQDDRDAFADLERAVAAAAHSTGLDAVLVQPLGLMTTCAWVASTAPIDPQMLGHMMLDPDLLPGVHLAVGDPGHGPAGFRRSHRQAGEARRVATLTDRPAGSVTRYADIALTALTTVDATQAREFVQAQLGALGALDPAILRLAATLAAYLDGGSSHARAARQLGVHENTVRYRVRQAEDLLGRHVNSDTLELRVALRLAEATRA